MPIAPETTPQQPAKVGANATEAASSNWLVNAVLLAAVFFIALYGFAFWKGWGFASPAIILARILQRGDGSSDGNNMHASPPGHRLSSSHDVERASGKPQRGGDMEAFVFRVLRAEGMADFSIQPYVDKLHDHFLTTVDQLRALDSDDWARLEFPESLSRPLVDALHARRTAAPPHKAGLSLSSSSKVKARSVLPVDDAGDDDLDLDSDWPDLDPSPTVAAHRQAAAAAATTRPSAKPISGNDSDFGDFDDF
eukprot:GABV01001542.1.p1 GENE.GABV01001542.1~~GABV01001542.1.p1  ORF type:complete len:274 (-),score=91.28 GABV01001542.1:43-798(-)